MARIKSFFTNRTFRLLLLASVLRPFSRKAHWKKWRYSLSIVAIIKNERPYIREWVLFHLLAGVEHIYLYDNDSNDGTFAEIADYVAAGKITVVPYPGVGVQIGAYQHAISTFWRESKYFAVIDADEFLYPSDINLRLLEVVENVFSKHKNVGSIGIPWVLFGTSGHKKPPSGLVTDNFLFRSRDTDVTIKSIVLGTRVFSYSHVHCPVLYWPFKSITEFGDSIEGPFLPRPLIIGDCHLRLNHYATKSLDEWIERQKKGKADGNGNGQPRWELLEILDRNDCEDTTARDYFHNWRATCA